jgi:cytoskeletal protein CcmA (bactofilin family)
MAWFKGKEEADLLEMSTSFFDNKDSRPALETRFPELDVKPPFVPAVPQGAAMQPGPTLHSGTVVPSGEIKPVAEPKPAPDAKPLGSVLGPTLHFKGELRADEDFVLQGRVEGSIHHTQNLVIGVEGVVKGDSRALTIVVEGTVDGDLYALESISVSPTARVHGNLLAPRVSIADGASFNGKVDMASATRAVRSIAERQYAALDEPGIDHVLSGDGVG